MRRIFVVALAVWVMPGPRSLFGECASGCEYSISTVAGVFNPVAGVFNPNDGVDARHADLTFPVMAIDRSGSLFLADGSVGKARIRIVTPAGLIQTLIESSFLEEPSALAVDDAGAVYIADRLANRVSKVQANGSWQLVAGNGTATSLESPRSLAIDPAGNLYIGDNGRINQVSPDGSIRTIARSGDSLHISSPSSIAADDKGNVYFVDSGLSSIASAVWMIAANGAIRKLFDFQHPRFRPGGIAVDSTGTLLIADSGENRILKLAPNGEMESVAKGVFLVPSTIGLDGKGNIYVFDRGDSRIIRFAADGSVETVAGGGRGFAGDGGPAVSATLSHPAAVALDDAGNLYVLADGRVRKVTPDGLIQTVAGNGGQGSPADPTAGYAGDGGPATEAGLEGAESIAVDPSGALFISHYGRIRKVEPDGLIRTFAGPFPFIPDGIAVDLTGSLYAAVGGAILKMTSDGVEEPLQSVPGAAPQGSLALALDRQGNLWIVEKRTQTIYQLTSERGLVPFARPEPLSLFGPAPRIARDATGNLFLSDAWNSAIYRVAPDGLTQRIAGDGAAGYSGDGGPAFSARLAYPLGIAVDTDGNVFVADARNHRIRKLTPTCR